MFVICSIFLGSGIYLQNKAIDDINGFYYFVEILVRNSYYQGCYGANESIEICKKRAIEHTNKTLSATPK